MFPLKKKTQYNGGPYLEERGAIAALDVLHDHAQVFLGLEGALKAHHERVVGEAQNVALGEGLRGGRENQKSSNQHSMPWT